MGKFLKQQTSITVYRLSTKEKKTYFSVCKKQMEICHPIIRLQQTNDPFSINIYIEMTAYI
jgi:hypothetical protein